MKFCSKCGGHINEGISFCPHCGTKLAVTYQESIHHQPYEPSPYTQPSLPPAVEALRKLGASPLFLAAIILYALSALFSFFSSVSDSSGIMGFIYRIASMLDAEYAIYSYMDEIYSIASVGSIISSLIGMIPAILVWIGLLLVYKACRNPKGNTISLVGFNVLKVLKILGFVFSCIGFFLVEFILLIALIASASTFSGSETEGILLAAMAIILVAAVISIIYYIKLLKSLDSAKYTILTGTPDCRASRFVGVMCFIGAALSVAGILGQIIALTAGVSALNLFFGMISAILSATEATIFGILIFRYRSKMKSL